MRDVLPSDGRSVTWGWRNKGAARVSRAGRPLCAEYVLDMVGCEKHPKRHRAGSASGLGAQNSACARLGEQCRVNDVALQAGNGSAMLRAQGAK